MASQNRLALLPLGGCGEIGMNMTVLFVNDDAYFIDCGCLFPDMSQSGVDLILPGYSYLAAQGIKPKAWIITHGHEDHIGGLPFFFQRFPAPIYASRFAAELIAGKFADLGITKHKMTVWDAMDSTKIGLITVTPFLVNHSIPHAMGLLIETPHGRILHTGDFRIDDHPSEELTTDASITKVLAGKRADIMLSDSTNSFSKGTDLSETDLVLEFDRLMLESTGAVIVASFSSNIWRAKTVVEAAKKAKRKIYLLGRGTRKNFQIAVKLGIINENDFDIIEDKELKRADRQHLCILCTGSQGEPFSGLHRLAYDSVPAFKLDLGDVAVFSARAIPGNEKPITYLTNQLCKRGVKVVQAKDADIHVSGHGFQEDLIACIKAARPRFFMPVHGEYRHLQKHIELAGIAGVAEEHCVLAENGSVVTLEKGKSISITEQFPATRSYVCQGGIYVDEGDVYRDRTQLAKNGLVVVSITLPSERPRNQKAPAKKGDQKPKILPSTPPQVSVFGVPIQESILADEVPGFVENAIETVGSRKDANDEILAEELRIAVRRYIETLCRFRCLVKVMIHRI
jgi:ribonuclease J